MAKEYWKKRHAPESCPDCGASSMRPSLPVTSWIKEYYTSWHVYLVKKHPKWKIPCWFGHCSKCVMQDLMTGPSFLEHLHKHRSPSDWIGRDLRVPFSIGK